MPVTAQRQRNREQETVDLPGRRDARVHTELTAASRWALWSWRCGIATLGVFSFVPVASALAPALREDWMDPLLPSWGMSSIAAGFVAALLVMFSTRLRRNARAAWTASDANARVIVAISALISLALGVIAAWALSGGFPLHIDDMTQAVQARIFAQGRPWLQTPANPEFTSTLLIVDHGGKTFSQFPPGWSAFLALGELVHAPWLIAPLLGALITVTGFWMARALGEDRTFAAVLAVLLAVNPWLILNAATQMNHLGAAAFITIASALLIGACGPTSRPGWLIVSGFCIGLAATMRPLDAAAFAGPAAVWLSLRAIRGRRADLIAYLGGLIIPITLLGAYNQLTTGGALTFGYEAQWGAIHGLGFHDAPWGPPHTALRGIGYLNKYLLRLQLVLFESPVPALLAPIVALALARKLSSGDRYLLASSAALCAGYVLYWHEGEYLGPRFLLPLAPVILLWTARLPRALRGVFGSPLAARFGGAWIAVAFLAGFGRLPRVAAELKSSAPLRRIDAAAMSRAVGARSALVFVPSAWAAQLAPRLWALGVPHRDAQILVDSTDLCALDERVSLLEADGIRGPEVVLHLRSLSRLAAQTPRCRQREASERRGTWSLLPFLQARDGNTYVRDLNERDEIMLRRHPGPYYVVRPDATFGSRKPQLVRFDVDSARRVWATIRASTAASQTFKNPSRSDDTATVDRRLRH
ncbi:MAG TPA: hypothetical protein VFT29_07405 [Gemmatimonadaceae bacterium]|nr:hypothetical protein [Gemmatimonadaceae bacterium]